MTRVALAIAAALLAAVAAACVVDDPDASPLPASSVRVALAAPADIAENLSAVVVTVTAEAMDPVIASASLLGHPDVEPVEIDLVVPAGPERQFAVDIFDKRLPPDGPDVAYSGTATLDLVAGPRTVEIETTAWAQVFGQLRRMSNAFEDSGIEPNYTGSGTGAEGQYEITSDANGGFSVEFQTGTRRTLYASTVDGWSAFVRIDPRRAGQDFDIALVLAPGAVPPELAALVRGSVVYLSDDASAQLDLYGEFAALADPATVVFESGANKTTAESTLFTASRLRVELPDLPPGEYAVYVEDAGVAASNSVRIDPSTIGG
ncbi:hypothetical protein K8I61_16995 [bacterium]|nr:hypothetical protein [bacterium]